MPRPRALLCIAAAALAVGAVPSPSPAATDPYRASQWGLSTVAAVQAWSKSTGRSVVIAIVDTGIDTSHPDLASKIVSSYDCRGGTCRAGGTDDNGHGTHVAGIAAAATGNGVGIAGVAPDARLMGVKVLDADGSGACSDIDAGMRWAADHGARVVNLSLGPNVFDNPIGVACIPELQSAATYAANKGALVVIAAGNDSLRSLYTSSSLLVVGATGPRDEIAAYSNVGAEIYAPGGDHVGDACDVEHCVLSTWLNGGYAIVEGTSMATPHVSGVAALLLARGYQPTQVLGRLQSTADPCTPSPCERVNAARAVGAAARRSTSVPPPSPAASSRPRGSTSAGGSSSPRAQVAPRVLSSTLGPGARAAGPDEPGATGSKPPSLLGGPSVLGVAVAALLLTAGIAGRFAIRRRTHRAR